MTTAAHIISFNSRCPFHTRKCKCSMRVATMAQEARLYLERSSPKTLDTIPETPILTPGTKKQREAMHYFNTQVSHVLSTWGMDEFWEEILPRQAQRNCVIREQVVALSIAQRENLSGRGRRSIPALEAYGRAVKSLSEYMKRGKVSRHTASICCIVLSNVARGLGDESAGVHLAYGIRLLVEQQADARGDRRGETSTMEYERRIVQRRLGGMAFLAVNHGYSMPSLTDADWSWALSQDPIPGFDSSLAELQRSLTGLGIAALGARNRKLKSETADVKEIARLQTSLTEWKIAADAFGLRNEAQLRLEPNLARKFYSCLVQQWFGEQLVDEMRDQPLGGRCPEHDIVELVSMLERLTVATEACSWSKRNDPSWTGPREDFTGSWKNGMAMMLERAKGTIKDERITLAVDRALAVAAVFDM